MVESAQYWSYSKLRTHWRLVAASLLVFAALGLSLGLTRAPSYTAEARLAVGSGAMSDLNIPGFPTASADLASNYARWVNSRGMAGLDLPSGTESVAASPFPESNVIRVEAVAGKPSTAMDAVDRVSKRLVREVNLVAQSNSTVSLLQEVEGQSRRTAVAQLRLARLRRGTASDDSTSESAYLRASAGAARQELILEGLQDRYRRLVSDASTEATLTLVGNGANISGNDRWSAAQRFSLLGLGVGFLIALIGIRVVEGRGQRRARG